MSRRHCRPEEIIYKLREVEVGLASGRTVPKVGNKLGVTEQTYYRILGRNGLVKAAEVVGFKAGKEYHRRTSHPNEMWATDDACLKVVCWGTTTWSPSWTTTVVSSWPGGRSQT